MTAVAQDRADFYAFNPQNYLLAYCNTNGLNTANFYCEAKQDGSTGLVTFYIHPNADGAANASDTDYATPQVVDISPGDATVAAEVGVSA